MPSFRSFEKAAGVFYSQGIWGGGRCWGHCFFRLFGSRAVSLNCKASCETCPQPKFWGQLRNGSYVCLPASIYFQERTERCRPHMWILSRNGISYVSDSCLHSRRNGHIHPNKGGNEHILAPVVGDSIPCVRSYNCHHCPEKADKYDIWDQRG